MTTIDRITGQEEISDGKPHPGRRMTEEEFVDWCDDKTHAEWVDGEVIVMSSSSDAHNGLNTWITSLIRLFIEQRDLGAIGGRRAQVRFSSRQTRREPDVCFVSRNRLDRIHPTHIEGAPDLVVEVASPDSMARDYRE